MLVDDEEVAVGGGGAGAGVGLMVDVGCDGSEVMDCWRLWEIWAGWGDIGGVFQPREREGKVVNGGGFETRVSGVGVEDWRNAGGREDGGGGAGGVNSGLLELVDGREDKVGKYGVVVGIDGLIGSGGGGEESSSVGSTISPQSSSLSSATVIGFGRGATAAGAGEGKVKVEGDTVG